MSQPAQRQQRSRTDSRKGLARATGSAILGLAPSTIHGVGVFTRIARRKGERVRVWQASDCRFVSDKKARLESPHHLETYCVKTKGGYWCPRNFECMYIGWYLNHADKPNLRSTDGGGTYRATRNIKAGEELTIDYRQLDATEDNLPNTSIARPATNEEK